MRSHFLLENAISLRILSSCFTKFRNETIAVDTKFCRLSNKHGRMNDYILSETNNLSASLHFVSQRAIIIQPTLYCRQLVDEVILA